MNKSTLTLKLNPNNKTDLSKLNTEKSTEVTVEKLPTKHSKDKLENEVVKPQEIKLKNIATHSPEKVALDFQEIYNKLHRTFPKVINMDNPVIFVIGIHKELAKEVEISKQSIGKWLSWYVRKSKYYSNYKESMERYNLAGAQCGVVTEEEASYASLKTANWLKKKEDIQKEKP